LYAMNALFTFLAAVTIEWFYVLWVHYAERGRWLFAALASMGIGAAQVYGIRETVHNWHIGPFLVVGYGVGTALAVRFKTKRFK